MGRERLTTSDFVERARSIHGSAYDYSETEYVTIRHKVVIRCNKCGNHFRQFAYNHLSGFGCNKCNQSRGEKEIRELLDSIGVEYIEQAVFPGCRNKRPLRFDFFVPSANLLIEFDGVQHRHPVEFFGGKKAFKKRVKRDKIKNDFASAAGLNLLRIDSRSLVVLGVVNELLGTWISVPYPTSVCGAVDV